MKLDDEKITDELLEIEEIFDAYNADDNDYTLAIIRTDNGFESIYCDRVINGESYKKDLYDLYCGGLRVAKEIPDDDLMIIESGSKLYIEPLTATEYGLSDRTDEIVGKVKTK